MDRLAAERHADDNFSRFAIFPIQNIKFAEIENQFRCTPLNVFIQIPNCSVEEDSQDLHILLFFGDTFRSDDFLGAAKNKRMYPSPSD
jgi:hypothetical protein